MSTESPDISRREFLRTSSACALAAPLAGRSAEELLPADWNALALPAADDVINDEAYWRLVKKQFFIEDGLNYLNSGTYGPTLRAAYDALNRNFLEMGQNYIAAFRKNYLGEAVPNFMRKLAEFVGAKADEIALCSGTTEAMNYIVSGFDLKPGDEVLTTMHEHQGGIYPWLLKAKRYGVKITQLPLRTAPETRDEILDTFSRAITPRTKVLSFCHINYTDGTVLPVRELCRMARARGIISVVDGAQSMGMLNFKISDLECDFFAASMHKWLAAPYGIGLLYVREEMLERHWPTVVLAQGGWDTVDRNGVPGVIDVNYMMNYPKALMKYSCNIEYYGNLYWTTAQVMDFHNLIGRDRIEARIKSLAEYTRKGLRAIPGVTLFSAQNPTHQSGLVSFNVAGIKTSDLYFGLSREKKIVMRFVQHPGISYDANRISTNIFNLKEDVDAALAAIREKAKA